MADAADPSTPVGELDHAPRADRPAIWGVILAGGRARRMGGGDKPLRLLGGRTLLDHVVARIGPQVAGLALSANGDPGRFAAWNLPVLADPMLDSPLSGICPSAGLGPLGGMLAGLRWAAAGGGCGWLVCVPGDTPLLPMDLVVRLRDGIGGGPIAYAADPVDDHPVVALIGLVDGLEADLASFLAADAGSRSIGGWMRRHGARRVMFDKAEAFLNVNTPQQLAWAEAALGDGVGGSASGGLVGP